MTYGTDIKISIFFTMTPVGCEWSASCSGYFTPYEISPAMNWLWGWLGQSFSLDNVEKRKYLTLTILELQTLFPPSRSQSLYRLCSSGSRLSDVPSKLWPLLLLIFFDQSENVVYKINKNKCHCWSCRMTHKYGDNGSRILDNREK
jgi:hypothetical protein